MNVVGHKAVGQHSDFPLPLLFREIREQVRVISGAAEYRLAIVPTVHDVHRDMTEEQPWTAGHLVSWEATIS
jgi:hypothetical protein